MGVWPILKDIGAGYDLFVCMGGICKQGKVSSEAQRSQIMMWSQVLFYDFSLLTLKAPRCTPHTIYHACVPTHPIYCVC